jgi:hypothetical protein
MAPLGYPESQTPSEQLEVDGLDVSEEPSALRKGDLKLAGVSTGVMHDPAIIPDHPKD